MSVKLIDLTKDLVLSKVSPDDFESQFFKLWRDEGNSGTLAKDSKEVSECLYEIFDLAERYTSDPERSSIEIDENTLKKEAEVALKKFKFL
ncbi:colicin immunity protein [Enterobacter oligotrophicus]|uniref:colicin immunity domain-containing protein n=1 Tax=Enterobacter TaxID=547 RepID=UPI001C00F0EA|nr:colicin immunity domain-containing protein [Enterobacter oligotrophicus]MBT9425834.1 colicin immunity protein [Enterobacter oligotrophicus]